MSEHRGHFFGGPHDGDARALSHGPVPRVLFPQTLRDSHLYRKVASTGSTDPLECRDHVYLYTGIHHHRQEKP